MLKLFFSFIKPCVYSLFTVGVMLALAGCTKIVDVNLPESEPLLVVEGSIRNGEMPIVLLSKSQGYFDPIGNPLDGFYLGGATVSVIVDGTSYQLDEVCTNDLPQILLEEVAAVLGMDADILAMYPLCAYTSFDEFELIGNEGSTYGLQVLYDTLVLTATSKLQPVIDIDSSYFFIPQTSENDSLGFIMTSYTDPDTLGNAFRWSSRRMSRYPVWHYRAGQVKDPSFIYPLGSAWDDSFVNGQQFSFSAFRYSDEFESEPGDEYGFWKTGDTVLVRLETIDADAFDAIMSFESAAAAQGNPFAPPTNVITNIEGGLGWWIAYGASVDTVVCL